jgi:hypothetical protein
MFYLIDHKLFTAAMKCGVIVTNSAMAHDLTHCRKIDKFKSSIFDGRKNAL